MNVLVNWWKARSLRVRVALVGGLVALLLVLAGSAGARLFARETVTTVSSATDKDTIKRLTTENLELQEDLARTQNTLHDLKQIKVTTVHRVKAPGGSVTEDITTKVTSDETLKTQTTETASTKATSEVKVDESAIHTAQTDTKTVTTPVTDTRFLLLGGVGVQPFRAGALVASLHFDVRVLGPVYLGVFVYVPTTDLQSTAVGLEAGARFGN